MIPRCCRTKTALPLRRSCRRQLAVGRAVAISMLLLLLTSGVTLVGSAAQPARIITLGESLSPAEQSQLRTYFKVGPGDKILTITTDDTIKAMQGIFDSREITSAYSSTALTCRDLGDGLDVTTHNIHLVTPGLYAMALVTAGIGDATLVVAAPDGTDDVLGMTALAGVFKSWDIAPCASGQTNRERQRLALEELTLTVQLGQALGTADGVQQATAIVLETQKTIVTEHLTDKDKIDEAIATQEAAGSVFLRVDLREKLVDLMTRLANTKIDWSTYAAGWAITWSADHTRITMTGDGIAVRNARATATAQAAAALTATAQAAMTATANARATVTAAAQQTAAAKARMTAAAQAALTATASAQPTATPTAAPFSVAGKVARTGRGQISIAQGGLAGTPISFALDAGATIARAGKPAALGEIRTGDRAVLTVNGNTHRVTAMVVEPALPPAANRFRGVWWLALFGLLGIFWAKRRYLGEPFVVKRKPD